MKYYRTSKQIYNIISEPTAGLKFQCQWAAYSISRAEITNFLRLQPRARGIMRCMKVIAVMATTHGNPAGGPTE